MSLLLEQRSSTSVHGALKIKICMGAPLTEIQSHTPTALMRGATEKEIIPQFELLANNMQQQKSH